MDKRETIGAKSAAAGRSRALERPVPAGCDLAERLWGLCVTCHRRAVGVLRPTLRHAWPCVGAVAVEVHIAPGPRAIVVLRHRDGGMDCVHGPAAVDVAEAEGAPDRGHRSLRERFALTDRDSVFSVALGDMPEDATDIWAHLGPAGREELLVHVRLNLEYQARALGIGERRPPLGDTAQAIAELVVREGPLTAGQVAARLPAGRRTSEANIRRIFSEKLLPHYGFTNPRNGTGYRAPRERTWT